MDNKNSNIERRSSNRQPSLREQANARMRAASGKSSSQKPVKKTQTSQTQNVKPREATSQRRVQEPASRTQTKSNTKASTTTTRRSSSERPVQRPAAREVIQSERSRNTSRSSYNSRNKQKKSAFSKFWIFFGLYTALLLVLATLFLVYTDKSLKKFEKSQSEYYMSEYVKTFEQKVRDNSLTTDDFTIEDIDLTFVDTSVFMNDYISSLNNISSFTFERDPNSYNTESPIYNIFGDGNPVAQVHLDAISQSKLLAILTVMDWDVESLAPICSIDVTSYTFLIPSNYVPLIDGIPVAYSYQTGNVYDVEEFANISEYISMPQLVEYKVDNVLQNSTVSVISESGEAVPFEKDGNTITAKSSVTNATLSDDRREMSLKMVQTYEDFNTDDLSGPNHGLETAQGLFIKNSLYWNMAKQWATGVDITFTSAHRFNDPKYSNVVVDNYVEYSDRCYSVHIAFTKNMIFTRRDGTFSNDFDSTVYFVYYDDSDDETDNPKWYIADIIATTK